MIGAQLALTIDTWQSIDNEHKVRKEQVAEKLWKDILHSKNLNISGRRNTLIEQVATDFNITSMRETPKEHAVNNFNRTGSETTWIDQAAGTTLKKRVAENCKE